MAIGSGGGAWLWRAFADQVVERAAARAGGRRAEQESERWKNLEWNQAAETYRAHMRRLYAAVPVVGRRELVPLEEAWVDLYVWNRPLNGHNRLGPLYGNVPAPADVLRLQGSKLVSAPGGHRLFILGQPGAGKTVFLQRLAMQAVEGELDRIPILVSVREWFDSGLDLAAFMAGLFEPCSFPDALPFLEHVLTRGNALVMLDGLDVVPQRGGHRDRLCSALAAFCGRYPDHSCLITCRTAVADSWFESFSYVEIAGWTADQVRAYVDKWFAGDAMMRDAFLAEFGKEQHQVLLRRGLTPLLLSLLCVTFNETLRLAHPPVRVYEQAVNALLLRGGTMPGILCHRWSDGLSLADKRRFFSQMAMDALERDAGLGPNGVRARQIAVDEDGLPPEGAGDFAQAIGESAKGAWCGTLVEGRDGWVFMQRVLQEYLAAEYVADSGGEALYRLVGDHLDDDRWREVFRYTGGLLEDAAPLWDGFGDALHRLIDGDEQIERLLTWADRRAEGAHVAYRRAAVRCFYLFLASDLDLSRLASRDPAYELYQASLLDLSLAVDRGLERAIALDRNLSRVLDHVQGHTQDLSLDLVRARDLGLALYRDLSLNHALYRNTDLNFQRAQGYAGTIYAALSRAAESNVGGTLDRGLSLTLDRALDRALDRILLVAARSEQYGALGLDFYLGFTYKMISAAGPGGEVSHDWCLKLGRCLSVLASLSHQLVMPELGWALSGLVVPAAGAQSAGWTQLGEQLVQIMSVYRHIKCDWALAPEQIDRLIRHVRAWHLYIECLNQASVPNRDVWVDRVLLPRRGSGRCAEVV